MAWWTHILFSKDILDRYEEPKKEESIFAVFRGALREYIYENFIDILYFILSIFTYFYLGLSVIAFFFQKTVPPILPYIIDTLSEPYLGALGIYVILKEIERRRGRFLKMRQGEVFAIFWFCFLVAATLLTYFSPYYHLNIVYKTVVTNSLAALIIRIGTMLR